MSDFKKGVHACTFSYETPATWAGDTGSEVGLECLEEGHARLPIPYADQAWLCRCATQKLGAAVPFKVAFRADCLSLRLTNYDCCYIHLCFAFMYAQFFICAARDDNKSKSLLTPYIVIFRRSFPKSIHTPPSPHHRALKNPTASEYNVDNNRQYICYKLLRCEYDNTNAFHTKSPASPSCPASFGPQLGPRKSRSRWC